MAPIGMCWIKDDDDDDDDDGDDDDDDDDDLIPRQFPSNDKCERVWGKQCRPNLFIWTLRWGIWIDQYENNKDVKV